VVKYISFYFPNCLGDIIKAPVAQSAKDQQNG